MFKYCPYRFRGRMNQELWRQVNGYLFACTAMVKFYYSDPIYF